MQKANIPLNIMQMPTFPLGLKPNKHIKFKIYKAKVKAVKNKVKNKRGKRARARPILLLEDMPKLSIKLTFFNLISIFKNYISFNIFKNTYYSLCKLINKPVKLY